MFDKDKLVENLDAFGSDSRYKIYNIYYDKDDGRYFVELPKNFDIKSNENDSFYTVEVKYENRLDLIANLFYKNSRLWWVIAEANKIGDPTLVPLGTTLVIPSISSIYGVGGVLE